MSILDSNIKDFLKLERISDSSNRLTCYKMSGNFTEESMMEYTKEIVLNVENEKSNLEKLLNDASTDEMKLLCTIIKILDLPICELENITPIIISKYEKEIRKIRQYQNMFSELQN